MNLGDIIRLLDDEVAAPDALARSADLGLVAAVTDMAHRYDESLGEYVAGAVRRFANGASDEDWLAVMNALERTGEPAQTCLTAMVNWSLSKDGQQAAQTQACGCGGGHCG
ncbi:MAG: hypothetical protein U1E62_06790 [Alsobacter sp.]